jgi:lipopolysaccharide/colanic/teichoic acid biosynthesis glycosyltransferase
MVASAHTVRVGQIDLGSPAHALDRTLNLAARYQRETVAPVLKSLFDKIVATVALLALSPVLALITLAIVLHDGGPALFTQTRVGRGGQPFTVLKFRTMVPDAELRKAALLTLNEGDGVLFKLRQDPRITTVGRFLRRTSLDELPQLLNVMLGDMSLVGPRPALPVEVAQYSGNVSRRLAVKPGMTGLWQISGRSDLSHEDAVRLDLRYVDSWTLALDLRILWKTGAAVASGRGAY